MVDRDLADLYGVETKQFNQQVKRNIKRFPADFMFQLTDQEKVELVTNCDRFNSLKHSTSNPHVFTEQGVAMLSSVLNSDRAIEVNIQIMRVFTKLREMMLSNRELAERLAGIEKQLNVIASQTSKHDKEIQLVFDVMRKLMTYPDDGYKRTKIGFIVDK